jgi:triacylglycerol lipase
MERADVTESIVEEAIRLLSEPLLQPIGELSLLQQSLLFAEIARVAYFRPDIVWEAISAVGFEEIQFIDRDGAQAYIMSNQHDCVVACRGTEPHDWNDVKANANALTVLMENAGRVHRGFKLEVDDLWPRLESALRDNQRPLWFTGHSLGGALATICAGRCKLAEIPSNPEALFTFGSPRVGNNRFINFVKIQHYRWVNNNDIVARVPPPWLGYSHSGREMYFNAFGKFRRYTPWRRFRDRWYGFFLTLRKWQVDHLADHSMVKYVECIHRAVEDEAAGRIKPVLKGIK